MKKNKPENAADLMAQLKQGTGLGNLLEQAQVWERWPELAGPKLAIHGHPIGFRKKNPKVLMIAAESPVWVHRFAYAKWDIIGRINRMAGQELVSDLFVTHERDEGMAEEG